MKKYNPGFAMKIYRIQRFLYENHLKTLAKLISRCLYLTCNCVISPSTEIGSETKIPHSVGIVIHQNSVIGKRCTIYQNVTIGNGNGPIIGDDVIIGANAVVLGDIVIGSGTRIGAGAVVLDDIPSGGFTVVGVPGKIINNKERYNNI